MSTLTMNLITLPFTTTNRVRVALYLQSDDQAEIDSRELQGPLAQRTWTFPGLERSVAYLCRCLEIVGGLPVFQYFEFFFTTIGESIVKYHKPFIIRPDVTAGAITGEYVAVFDGSNGTEDLRGWDVSQLTSGSAFQDIDVQFKWDSATATLTLDSNYGPFDSTAVYNMQFETIVVQGGSASALTGGDQWKSKKTITDTYSIIPSDFGTKLIVKGEADFFRLTLPAITTVPPNRLLYIESAGGAHKGFALDVNLANPNSISWIPGNESTIYFNPHDRLEIYRERIDDVTSEWRVHHADGSWFKLGQTVYNDGTADMMINMLPMDGGGNEGRTTGLLVEDHAKFYYGFVAKLPGSQLAPFASWATGDNKYKYTLAFGNPLRFHIPDRRGMFLRSTSGSRLAGSFQDQDVQPLTGNYPVAPNSNTGGTLVFGRGGTPLPPGGTVTINPNGEETRPKNIGVNEYVFK